MDKILLIDGSSLIFRAFYAIRELSTKDGIPTNAVYGFITMFNKLMAEHNPKYVLVAFDRPGPTFRTLEYSDYKAGREKTPDGLNLQFGVLKDILDSLGVKYLDFDNYEADDILGTLSVNFNKQGIEAVIVSGDRDMLQLASENTSVVLTKKGITETVSYSPEKIYTEFGVNPKQLIDVKALMGDKSDNIPGVSGVGEKTAYKLISQYGSLDEVYSHLDELSGKKLVENLENDKNSAYMSRMLGEIFLEVPVDEDLSFYEKKDADLEKLREKYKKLEFNKFLKDLKDDSQLNDKKNIEWDAIFVSDAGEILDHIKNSKTITFKYFYDDENYIKSKAYVFGLKSDISDKILIQKFIGEDDIKKNILTLKEVYQNKDIRKISFDIKEDMYYLNKYGVDIENYEDTMIKDYLIDPSAPSYTIVRQAEVYISSSIKSDEEIRGKGAKRVSFSKLDDKNLIEYMGTFLKVTEKVNGLLDDVLKDRSMESLYNDIEKPLIKVLASMEKEGVEVDREVLEDIGKDLDVKISAIEGNIYNIAGHDFNINSPKQLGVVLFDELKLPVIKKTKTGYSTNAEVLEKLKDKSDLVEYVLEYRAVTKLKSTYIDGLLPLIDENGRIHSTFRQNITATGRISSQEPNLQNIPARSEEGRQIRKAFVAGDGNYLVDGDYSQIELRVLAHLSGDKVMQDSFEHGVDIHTKTASEVFQQDLSEVTSLQRSRAKAVNFGIVYGISDYGLSNDLGISRKEAKEYIDGYKKTYPQISAYMDSIIEEGKDKGFVETLYHRRRYVPELSNSNFNIRSFGERIALNTPIQGTAADIIKIAMIRVFDSLKKKGLKSKLILQVHDELIIQTAEDELEEVKKIIVEEMEGAARLDIKLVTDVNIGKNWYESK